MKVRPFFGFVGLTLLGVTILAGCDRDNLSIRTKGGAMASMDFRKTVQNAKAKVFPAVVYIKCLREEFAGGRKTTQEILGSGVIIDGVKGEVLTNWHVIDKAREIRCLLSDGRYFNAKKIGDDKDTDLALIQLQGIPKSPKGLSALPAAGFGESLKLKEGDFVMAMGAPFGLNRSVSIGIISCTRRYLSNSSEYSLWLQTDASINPGNSGGPLVDTDGKIIGINTRGGANMGFATPSHNILSILPQMREHGKVNWSWTGLQLQPLRNFNKNTYFDGDTGVIVSETEPDSPARRAGVQVRDRIIKLNGQPLTALWEEDLPAVRRRIGLLAKKKPAMLTILRNGKTIELPVTPREKGKVQGEELDLPRWDLTIKTINQFENKDLYFYHKTGVFVFGVKRPGNAGNAGLQAQDIILKVGTKRVTTLKDVQEAYDQAIKNIKAEHRILITVERNGLMQQKVLDFARDYEKE